MGGLITMGNVSQTSTRSSIPNSDDVRDFEPTYSTPIKQELDDPMFEKHIEQDIAFSNLLTQPHQTYFEIVQKQSNIKRENK